jgi:hypothetical protein
MENFLVIYAIVAAVFILVVSYVLDEMESE